MADPERERSGIATEEDMSSLLRALANKHRRAVVRILDETHTPVPRKALATYVAKERFPPDTGDNFIQFQDKLSMKLHHVHLPLLSDAEIIDLEDGIVTKGDKFGEALTLLDEIR